MKTSKQLIVAGITCLLLFSKIVAFAFNISTKDSQSVYPILAIVDCPPAYVGSCGESVNPDQTGWPIVDGNLIAPDYSCYHAVYSDNILNDCGNGKKITRSWTITNTCGDPLTQCVQIIKLSDNEAPELTCPDDVEVSCATDPSEFTGDPQVFDACGSTYTVDYDDTPYLQCTGNGYDITRVFTVTDACGNAASCAMSISILCRPTIQAYSINFPTVNSTSLEVEWYPGNGSSRIVVMNTVNSFSLPPDGYDPLPSTVYDGSGEQVIYNGQGESVTVTGLSPNTTYWFRVFEASDCSGQNLYLTTTSSGNPKSQKTSNPQFIHSFTITTTPPYPITPYSGPKIIAQGTSLSQILPIKICADGSKATTFEFINNDPSINSSNIRFLVNSDPAGNDSDKSGYFILTDYQVAGNKVKCKFTHPKFLSEEPLPYRSDLINIVDQSNPTNIIYSLPIRIYRPPLLFVHGWRGNGDTFSTMSQNFSSTNYYPNELMTLAYYSTSNEGFAVNSDVVRAWIYQAFHKSLSNNFSAGKVDVMGHSMGGILIRLYQQNNYNNKYRGEINKIITLNTPHSGSYLANAATVFFGSLYSGLYCATGNLLNQNFFGCYGATIDMQTYSAATDHVLNHPQSLAINHVPCHAIYTITDVFNSTDYNANPFNLGGAFLEAILNVYNLYVNGNPADGVVSVNSQSGGLSGSNSSFPAYHFHMYSSRHPSIIEQTKILLSNKPSSGLFSLNGFQPINLFDNPKPPLSRVASVADISRGNLDVIEIVSPIENSFFTSGQNVEVEILSSPNIKHLMVVSGNSDIGTHTIDSIITGTNNLLNIIIPEEAIGKFYVDVLGLDSSLNLLAFDTLSLNISTNAIIDSIEICPSTILVPTNLDMDYQVIGHFSDQIPRILTHHQDINFNIGNTNVAELIESGTIRGRISDSTYLISTYNSKKDSVAIYVYNGDSLRHAKFYTETNIFCNSDYVHFANATTGNPISFEWQFPGGTPESSTDINPSILYDSVGQFDVTLIATYPGYVDTLFLENYINIHPLPRNEIILSGPSEFCRGDSILLSVSDGVLFYWNTGESSQSLSIDSAGTYFVQITDTLGCTNVSEPIEITIWDPQAEISNEGDSILCIGESTELSASDAITYLWNTGETTQSIVVAKAGVYGVTITDQNGCIASARPFEVIESDSLIAEISSESNNFCLGDSVLLTSSEASSYIWNTGETSNSITVYSTGEYIVTLSDQYGCISVSSPVEISVYDLPSVNLGADITVNSDSFILDAGPNFTKYEWSTNDTTQIIVITTPGEYSITITDSNGCHTSDTIKVDFITGTSSLNALQGILVYPNPNRGFFHIESILSTPEELSYEIYDYLGRLVVTDLIESTAGKVNTIVSIPNASSGIYYLRLQLGSSSHVIKLVVL